MGAGSGSNQAETITKPFLFWTKLQTMIHEMVEVFVREHLLVKPFCSICGTENQHEEEEEDEVRFKKALGRQWGSTYRVDAA